MPFIIRQFNPKQTLGEVLKAMRKQANMTLSELAAKTKIRKSILHMFETNAYHKLPDPIYTRNFLNIVVRCLGGEVEYFLKRYEQERGTCDVSQLSRLPRPKVPWMSFFVSSRFFQLSSIGLLMIMLLAYLGFQVRTILTPPDLLIFQPEDGYQSSDATVIVSGKAETGTTVLVNGMKILLADDGVFRSEVVLERGLNVITVESAKRYSRSAVKYRRVIVSDEHLVGLK